MAIVKAQTHEEAAKTIEPYLIATGELVLAWNHLQEELARLFWRVTNIKNGAIAFAIWHSTPSDHTQRAMLRAAADIALDENEEVKKEVFWMLDRIDNSLRHKRNDAIHAPIVLLLNKDGATIAPHDLTNNPRAFALQGKEILQEIIWYRQTASVLRRFCWDLNRSLKPGKQHPLPKRPVLPHLGMQKVPADKHRGSSDTARRRPPRLIQEAP